MQWMWLWPRKHARVQRIQERRSGEHARSKQRMLNETASVCGSERRCINQSIVKIKTVHTTKHVKQLTQNYKLTASKCNNNNSERAVKRSHAVGNKRYEAIKKQTNSDTARNSQTVLAHANACLVIRLLVEHLAY